MWKIYRHIQQSVANIKTNMSTLCYPAWAWFMFILWYFLCHHEQIFLTTTPKIILKLITWKPNYFRSQAEGISFKEENGYYFWNPVAWHLCLFVFASWKNWVAFLCVLFLTYFCPTVSSLASYYNHLSSFEKFQCPGHTPPKLNQFLGVELRCE